jgi:sugar phosphate isomerase/epimerase
MSGLKAGLCSVTFRNRSPADIVQLASRAGLDCIEWGGDVHVTHGDVVAAQRVARLTHEAGMSVCSYGSYLFADEGARDATEAVLDTTEALDAPAVRVWAPPGVEPGCSPEQFEQVADSLGEISAAADRRGLLVYVEFHGGTLTATARSAAALLDRVGADNLLCAWQPPYWNPLPVEHEVADLALLAPRLGHLHVYSWRTDGTREPLEAHVGKWPARLAAASRSPVIEGWTRSALLEFVAEDSEDSFLADAARLVAWLDDPEQGSSWHPSSAEQA